MNNNILLPKFPDDFFHYKTSPVSYVTEEEINSWIKEGIEELEENSGQKIWGRSTGDTSVEINKIPWIDNQYTYEVIVSRGRYEARIFDKNNPNDFYKSNY